MNRAGSLLLILLGLLILSEAVTAQSLRMRTQAPVVQKEDESPWDATLVYRIATDYADTNKPRGYANEFLFDLGYKLDKSWTLTGEVGARADFFDGQIEKGSQQSYDETISPTTNLELSYAHDFMQSHKYELSIHAEPLWDQASHLEGYKALYGAGGNVALRFFNKRYTFMNSLDVTELQNTYYYGSDLTANPDYFVTYRLTNSLKFLSTWKISYIFGMKTTRYLDGFWGYNYENNIKLAKSFGKLSASLAYMNGGFTDDGTLSLWYIDQYRSMAVFGINYEF
jgi:hypothetical protein